LRSHLVGEELVGCGEERTASIFVR